MPAATPLILCEIAADRVRGAALAEIVELCARDAHVAIQIQSRTRRLARDEEPVITLHLPAEFAATQHPVWCLACRLACFCPRARVSVLVRGETLFAQERASADARASAAAQTRSRAPRAAAS